MSLMTVQPFESLAFASDMFSSLRIRSRPLPFQQVQVLVYELPAALIRDMEVPLFAIQLPREAEADR
jgi:hypothetical protein